MAQKYFGSNIPVAAGFDLAAQRPLDAREVVAKYSDLATIPDIQKYAGLKVYVEEQKKYHFWIDLAGRRKSGRCRPGRLRWSYMALWISGSLRPGKRRRFLSQYQQL